MSEETDKEKLAKLIDVYRNEPMITNENRKVIFRKILKLQKKVKEK